MNTTSNQSLDSIYQSLAQLNVADLDTIMQQIIGLRKQKGPNILSQKETDLLRNCFKTYFTLLLFIFSDYTLSILKEI